MISERPEEKFLESAQAARRGIKGKKNPADLAAPRESVVREFLESGGAAMRLHTDEELWVSAEAFWKQRQAAEVGRRCRGAVVEARMESMVPGFVRHTVVTA
ncbi:MAG: hypothetical protein ACRD7E_04420 [Bryobacteraceae bacterium]